MATSQDRRAAQRRLAKQIREGTYKPSPVGARARQAASVYEQVKSFDKRDVPWLIKIVKRGWWDNGESLSEYRRTGSAESVFNYADDLAQHGVPSNIINVVPYIAPTGDNRSFNVYATRDTG